MRIVLLVFFLLLCVVYRVYNGGKLNNHLLINKEIPTVRSLYVCTKFQLSADRIQLFKGITGLEFTLRHWHKLFVEVSLYL